MGTLRGRREPGRYHAKIASEGALVR